AGARLARSLRQPADGSHVPGGRVARRGGQRRDAPQRRDQHAGRLSDLARLCRHPPGRVRRGARRAGTELRDQGGGAGRGAHHRMSKIEIVGIIIGVMLVLIALRVPLGAAIFVAGAGGYWWLVGEGALLNYLKGLLWARFSVYDLSVIP